MTIYTKNVSEPWFSLIKLGLKKCEGRLYTGDFAKMNKGDYIIFANDSMGFQRVVKCRITSIHLYNSFRQYLQTETINKCLPGIDGIDDGVQVYYKYYTQADETTYGICAIRLHVTK